MNITKLNFFFLVLFLFLKSASYCQSQKGNNPCPIDADIWVLAGQSNMDGCGRTPDTLTDPNIYMLGLDNKWVIAQNPLHHIYNAAAPAYELTISQFPVYKNMDPVRAREELAIKREESKKKPIGGVGPGIYFARHLLENIGSPVALIPCGIGGTTMEQWSPGKKKGGDSTLYGAMINRINSAGGSLKGLIWFQGESEAMSGNTTSYEKDLIYLISSLRKDTGYPELPVIIVQIGCFIIKNSVMDKGYEQIREVQRSLYKKIKNVFVAASIDLPLDDWVHISTAGHKRLGRRIGELALSGIYKIKGHSGQIDLDSIKMCKDDLSSSNYLLVSFSGITGKLECCERPAGFELRVNGNTTYEFVIAKTELDRENGSALRLYLSGVPSIPSQIVYGPGTNPYMNLTDSADNGIPSFGPVEIPLE